MSTKKIVKKKIKKQVDDIELVLSKKREKVYGNMKTTYYQGIEKNGNNMTSEFVNDFINQSIQRIKNQPQKKILIRALNINGWYTLKGFSDNYSKLVSFLEYMRRNADVSDREKFTWFQQLQIVIREPYYDNIKKTYKYKKLYKK